MRAQFAAAPPAVKEQIVPKNLGLTHQAIRCRCSAASKRTKQKNHPEDRNKCYRCVRTSVSHVPNARYLYVRSLHFDSTLHLRCKAG